MAEAGRKDFVDMAVGTEVVDTEADHMAFADMAADIVEADRKDSVDMADYLSDTALYFDKCRLDANNYHPDRDGYKSPLKRRMSDQIKLVDM